MTQHPKVSIVTPIHNGIEHTVDYLDSLSRISYPHYEVVIVDDGSTDGSAERISASFPQVRIVSGDGNLWWAGGTNAGIRDALARGTDFILTMNNDVEVAPDLLDVLLGCAADHPGAIIGGKIYVEDRSGASGNIGVETAAHAAVYHGRSRALHEASKRHRPLTPGGTQVMRTRRRSAWTSSSRNRRGTERLYTSSAPIKRPRLTIGARIRLHKSSASKSSRCSAFATILSRSTITCVSPFVSRPAVSAGEYCKTSAPTRCPAGRTPS